MIVLWPQGRLLDLTHHAPRLTSLVIALSFGGALLTVAGLLAVWFKPKGLRTSKKNCTPKERVRPSALFAPWPVKPWALSPE